jgi:hypothetical protein
MDSHASGACGRDAHIHGAAFAAAYIERQARQCNDETQNAVDAHDEERALSLDLKPQDSQLNYRIIQHRCPRSRRRTLNMSLHFA